jgi:Flp pilus assembly protein TadG
MRELRSGAFASARPSSSRKGQAAIEFVLLYSAVILPLTFGIVYVAEMYWVWHSMVEFTREGARYAATHCFQSDSANVISFMQTHVPVNIDLNQFQTGGTAQIQVQYFSLDPTASTPTLIPAACDGTCSTACVPDAVTVSVTNYEFRRFVSFVHLPPVVMPAFPTSMPVESNGCDPEQNVCNP